MLTGDWQAGSDLEWPNQSRPAKTFRAVFRKCLRATFCTKTSAHQPVQFAMEMDEPLGMWHPVARNTWWPTYKAKDDLYYRMEGIDGVQVFKSRGSGYYTYAGEAAAVPLYSHPITCQHVGEKLWTHRKMKPSGKSVLTNTTHTKSRSTQTRRPGPM